MTWLAIYAIIKFWLPIVTVLTLLVKAFNTIVGRVSEWANKLFDNHMNHIQDSVEKAAVAVVQLVECQKGYLDTQTKIVSEISTMRSDFAASSKELMQGHHQMMMGIEVLKDRV